MERIAIITTDMEGDRLSVREVAEECGVTTMAVYQWFQQGLRYETFKEIGRKEYKVTTLNEVEKFMKYRYEPIEIEE